MPRPTTLQRIGPIAEDQWGLITRRQAEKAGIPDTTLERVTREGAALERIAQGVYRLNGTPLPDHLQLRAAWLQLAPDMPAWDRTIRDGVVSHRSAAALYGISDLPADRHEFTMPTRRQSRRSDVRVHTRKLQPSEWVELRGLPVTRPSRIASDLLYDREDPKAVSHLIVEAIRQVYDNPGTLAESLNPHASRFGLRRGDGLALLRWLLDLVGDANTPRWVAEARDHVAHNALVNGQHTAPSAAATQSA
jgi:hypothetical protein